MDKIKKCIDRIIQYILLILMLGIVAIVLVVDRFNRDYLYYDMPIHNWVILIIVILMVFFSIWFFKGKKDINLKKYWLLIATIALFIVQLVVYRSIKFAVGWDVDFMNQFSHEYVNGALSDFGDHYFKMYPNNVLIFFVYVTFVKIGDVIGINGISLLEIFGIICVDLAIIFSTLIAKEIFKRKGVVIATYIILVLFLGLSPWIIVPYTDVLSLWIPVASLYLYIRLSKQKKNVILCTVAVCVLPVLGMLMKPTNIFILIAIFVHWLLNNNDLNNIKKWIQIISAVIITIVIYFSSRWIVYKCIDYVPDDSQAKVAAHFLLMGSNPESHGIFNFDDDYYTSQFPSKEEKTRADMELFKQRIIDMGFVNTIKHYTKKTNFIFNNGILGWGKEANFIEEIPQIEGEGIKEFFRNIYYLSGDYVNEANDFKNNGKYSIIYVVFNQFIWIFILLMCVVSSFFKSNNYEIILRIAVIGICMFAILFEANTRYLINYMPAFILMAFVGYEKLSDKLEKYIKKTGRNGIENENKE